MKMWHDNYTSWSTENLMKKAKLELSGLHVDELNPFMGASPDSLMSCKCCGDGLVEVNFVLICTKIKHHMRRVLTTIIMYI